MRAILLLSSDFERSKYVAGWRERGEEVRNDTLFSPAKSNEVSSSNSDYCVISSEWLVDHVKRRSDRSITPLRYEFVTTDACLPACADEELWINWESKRGD